MIQVTNSHKNRVKIGAQQSYKNLTMFPLLSNNTIPPNSLTTIGPLSKYNTEQNRSACNTIWNHDNDRVMTSWDYIEQFARVNGQIGAIFLINGKLAGMVCCFNPEAFKKSFIKLVECYAGKADDEYDPKIVPKSSKSEVINFLKTPVGSGIKIQTAIGI
jgi:hypothetical protein